MTRRIRRRTIYVVIQIYEICSKMIKKFYFKQSTKMKSNRFRSSNISIEIVNTQHLKLPITYINLIQILIVYALTFIRPMSIAFLTTVMMRIVMKILQE